MYITNRHYILLILAVAAFGASALSYFLFRYMIVTKAIHSSEVKEEIKFIDERRQYEQDIVSIYTKSAEDLKLINGLAISRGRIVDFIEYVEKVGVETSTDLKLSAINNEETEAQLAKKGSNPLSYLKAHVEAQGSWANVMRALTLLEHMPFHSTISSIRLVEAGDSQTSTSAGSSETKPAQRARHWTLSLDVRILTTK